MHACLYACENRKFSERYENDFRNYAVNHLGMSSNTLDSYARHMEKTAEGVLWFRHQII